MARYELHHDTDGTMRAVVMLAEAAELDTILRMVGECRKPLDGDLCLLDTATGHFWVGHEIRHLWEKRLDERIDARLARRHPED